MNKIIEYIKNQNKPTLITTSIVVFSLALFIWAKLNTPSKTQPAYKSQILPKQTTQEVINKLGQPKNEANWQGYQILNYDNPTNKWNDQVFTQNNQVSLISEIVDSNNNKIKTQLISEYGQPEIILYGPHSPIYDLYAYPSIGFAFLGNEKLDDVFQKWYFAPTTSDNFKNTIAKEQSYSDIKPEEGF